MLIVMASHDDEWTFIEERAAELGVNAEAVRKWRERNRVPYRWHMPLIRQFALHGRMVSMDFFEKLKTASGPDNSNSSEPAAAE